MPEIASPRSPLVEQLSNGSPIHRWARESGVHLGHLLDDAEIFGDFRTLFHRLIIARGKYSWEANLAQAQAFRKDAISIMGRQLDLHTQDLHMDTDPHERAIFLVYGKLVQRWVRDEMKKR